MMFAQSAAAAVPAQVFSVDPETNAKRCEEPGFAACLEINEASCKSKMREAAKAANAAVKALADKEPLTPARLEFLRGLGAGRVVGTMNRSTDGKFIGCVKKE